MKVKLSKLKHHPLNERIYSLSGIDSLMESIKEVGLLEPPTCDQFLQTISGNRRLEACKRLGMKEIEVHKIHVNKGDEVLTLIHFNRQRVKTFKELLNEYDELSKYHKNKGSLKGRKIRNIVSEDLKVKDSLLARLLFIRKNRPDYIEIIDDGILTTNQAYLKVRRELDENISKIDSKKFKTTFKSSKDDFTFYKKSSDKLLEIKSGQLLFSFCSPPYPLSIRKEQYADKVVIGNEKTVEEYSENLSEHLKILYEKTHIKGSCFINLGDVYNDGCLQSAPHRVILKLLEKTKFKLRSSIIFKKSNYKPSSVKNRSSNSYEYVFHLVKSDDYYFERALIPNSEKTKPSHAPRHRSKNTGNLFNGTSPYIPNPKGKNIPDYWDDDLIVTSVANQSLNYGIEHPAMYHPSLVTIPLLQVCVLPFINSIESNKIDFTILDGFCGSLNTFKSMKWVNDTFGTNLKFIGYDIKKYF